MRDDAVVGVNDSSVGGQVVDVRRCQVEECPEKPVRRDAAKRADA